MKKNRLENREILDKPDYFDRYVRLFFFSHSLLEVKK